jgi:hypothetical protein
MWERCDEARRHRKHVDVTASTERGAITLRGTDIPRNGYAQNWDIAALTVAVLGMAGFESKPHKLQADRPKKSQADLPCAPPCRQALQSRHNSRTRPGARSNRRNKTAPRLAEDGRTWSRTTNRWWKRAPDYWYTPYSFTASIMARR